MVAERNWFLDKIGTCIHSPRPNIPEGFDWTKHVERAGPNTFVNIRVRSRGCHHNRLGGCTMCDYWAGNSVNSAEMVAFAREALDSLDFAPTLLIIGPSGSWFDDWEVPPEVRPEFYRMIEATGASAYLFFTRADTITEAKLEEMSRYLDLRRVSIEMGLETADSWKLRYCINKGISLRDVATAADLIRRHGASSTAYILVGVPFLTTSEMIQDSISSVNWALNNGIDYAVVFPVHIKPWTVVYWLHEHEMYPRTSLWSLVEVLANYPAETLKHIGISWHASRPDRIHPLYGQSDIVPTTCPLCYDRVVAMLDDYRFSTDRGQIVQMLQELNCECKRTWRQELEGIAPPPLVQRVKDAYRQMGQGIMGYEWWESHGSDAVKCITEPTQ